MDGSGHQFFTSPGFSGDKNGDIMGGHAADRLVNRLHRGTAADHRVATSICWFNFGHQSGNSHLLTGSYCPVDDLSEYVQVKRFQQVIEGPGLDGLNRQIRGAMPRDEQHRYTGIHGPHTLEGLQAGGVWQMNVQHDNIRRIARDRSNRPRGRERFDHGQVTVSERDSEGMADRRFIINDQEFRHRSDRWVKSE